MGFEVRNGPSDSGEGQININPSLGYKSIDAGTWVLAVSASHYSYAYWYNSTSAQNDAVTYNAYLAKGTYTLGLLSQTNNNEGIITVKIDGVSVGTIDLYSAGIVRNVRSLLTGIPITESKLYEIQLIMATKNGASSSYQCVLNDIELWRTA